MSMTTFTQEYMFNHMCDQYISDISNIGNILLKYTTLPTCIVKEILPFITCPLCLSENVDFDRCGDTFLCILCIQLRRCPVCDEISEHYGKVCNSCMNECTFNSPWTIK